MRAPSPTLLAAFAAVLVAVPAFGADAKDEKKPDAKKADTKTEAKAPVDCVVLARSWDAAIAEGKARCVPIVLHNHGFYCPPCWGLHASVMGDAAYREFAYEGTVEVLALDRLQDGVDKKEERAATYEAKVGGKTVSYLVEFPGLTVEEAVALNRSKAGSYNKTGGLPYTALIDPFTEVETKVWKGGGVKAEEIIEAAKAARTVIAKAHGKGKPRPELRAVTEAQGQADTKTKAGDFAGALDALEVVRKRSEKDGWPSLLKERVATSREGVVASATQALEAVEATKADDAVKARKDLLALQPRLRGTGLEARAKALLAGL